MDKFGFLCACPAFTFEDKLSLKDAENGFENGVVNESGLVVLGEQTALEKDTFAEIDAWHGRMDANRFSSGNILFWL